MRALVILAAALGACGQPPAPAEQATAPAPTAQIVLSDVAESALEGGAACWARDASGVTVFASNGGTGFVTVNGKLTQLELIGDDGASADGAVRTLIRTTADPRELQEDVVGGPAELTVSVGEASATAPVTYACAAGY